MQVCIHLTFRQENIMMVEGELNEVSEAEMLEAIKFAHEAIKPMCVAQKELREMCGVTEPAPYCHEVNDEDLRKKVWDETYDKAYAAAMTQTANKHERERLFNEVKENFLAQYTEEELETVEKLVDRYYHDVQKEAVRQMVLNERVRLDGRKTDEIRPIWCEVDYLPTVHGSAIFTRGETQSLSTVTLGNKLDEQTIDGAMISGSESFLLHYNFPPEFAKIHI